MEFNIEMKLLKSPWEKFQITILAQLKKYQQRNFHKTFPNGKKENCFFRIFLDIFCRGYTALLF